MQPTDVIPEEVLNQFASLCMKHTVAVFFGDPREADISGFNSATGVLLKIQKPILVTAAHVIEKYLDRKHSEPKLEFEIGNSRIDNLHNRIISHSTQFDLSTVDLTGVGIKKFDPDRTFHEAARWPPKRVSKGTNIIIAGFPMDYRQRSREQREVSFGGWWLDTLVDSSSDKRFSCHVDLSRLQQRSGRRPGVYPNCYGGVSGSPIFAVRDILELVGIADEAGENFQIITAHHTDWIQPDGTIRSNFV